MIAGHRGRVAGGAGGVPHLTAGEQDTHVPNDSSPIVPITQAVKTSINCRDRDTKCSADTLGSSHTAPHTPPPINHIIIICITYRTYLLSATYGGFFA